MPIVGKETLDLILSAMGIRSPLDFRFPDGGEAITYIRDNRTPFDIYVDFHSPILCSSWKDSVSAIRTLQRRRTETFGSEPWIYLVPHKSGTIIQSTCKFDKDGNPIESTFTRIYPIFDEAFSKARRHNGQWMFWEDISPMGIGYYAPWLRWPKIAADFVEGLANLTLVMSVVVKDKRPPVPLSLSLPSVDLFCPWEFHISHHFAYSQFAVPPGGEVRGLTNVGDNLRVEHDKDLEAYNKQEGVYFNKNNGFPSMGLLWDTDKDPGSAVGKVGTRMRRVKGPGVMKPRQFVAPEIMDQVYQLHKKETEEFQNGKVEL